MYKKWEDKAINLIMRYKSGKSYVIFHILDLLEDEVDDMLYH